MLIYKEIKLKQSENYNSILKFLGFQPLGASSKSLKSNAGATVQPIKLKEPVDLIANQVFEWTVNTKLLFNPREDEV